MPRLVQALPRYRKHRASGQAVVTLNGVDFYLGPHGTKASRQEYDRAVAEWLANGRQAPTPAAGLSVLELIDRFWTFAAQHYVKDGEPTGEIGALRAALKPVYDLYGPTPAANFGPLALEAVRGRMVAAGWSRGTVNRSVNRVRRLFRWGVSKQLIPAGVAQALEAVDGLRRGRTEAPEAPPVLPVDVATVDATLEHLPPIVADMVRLQRLTGMRPAEVCILRPRDLDRSGDVWMYRPESHKTEHHGRERVVYIGPRAQSVLLRYLARDAETFCFRPCDSMAKHLAARRDARQTPENVGNRPGSNRVRRPRRQAGERYDVDAYRRAIHRAADKAFPHPDLSTIARRELTADQAAELAAWQSTRRWSPNQLRHAAATDVRRDFGLEAAQVVLGHAAANVTQVYAERDAAKGREVAKAIG
jgi:integrase